MRKILIGLLISLSIGGLFIIRSFEVEGKKINNFNEIVLINDKNILDKEYIPDLKNPKIKFVQEATEEERSVDKKIVEDLEMLFEAGKRENINLVATSGYRSYESQEEIYERELKKNGIRYANKYVAKPGKSEHQSGLCIDVTNEGRYFGGETREAIWLAENCYKYGFIIRYNKNKENITKKAYEPWHIRYVGADAAKKIYEEDLCLEEYLGG